MAEPDVSNWHPNLPLVPSNFPQVASFALQHDEAEYLRERVLTRCDGSLLAHLLRDGEGALAEPAGGEVDIPARAHAASRGAQIVR